MKKYLFSGEMVIRIVNIDYIGRVKFFTYLVKQKNKLRYHLS